MIDLFATFFLLFALELVLGVDNILVISILVGRIEDSRRNQARIIGLALAFLLRVVMLVVLLRITDIQDDLFWGLSIRDIVIMDAVFSLDSVITAIGLTHNLVVIIAAVMVSMSVILVFAKPVGDFILAKPSIKILALAFLITIGVTLFLEGMNQSVPRSYLYLPMGFAIAIELLQMRYEHNKKIRAARGSGKNK
jgi:predicted tellurium resistance membrane protein TerC